MFVATGSGDPSSKRPPPRVESFGQQLRRLRKQEGLSQEKLEEMSGISQSKISKLERDDPEVIVSREEIIMLAGAVKTSPQSFLPRTAPMSNRPNHERTTGAPVHPASPPQLHPLVRASLDSYLERKGEALSSVQLERLPRMALGVNPHDENVPMDDDLWDELAGVIFRRYRNRKAS